MDGCWSTVKARNAGWLALLGPDRGFVPIEPWGRSRSADETARVDRDWDEITGDTFWNPARDLHFRYHPALDVWDQDDAGTFNAVHEFLRGLGCRWFVPGEIGEVIPTLDTVAVPDVRRTVTPDFAVRRFIYYTEHTGIGDKALWNLRLGLNHGAELVGFPQICHGMKFVIKREEMKRAHPEMYLPRGGTRDTTFKEDGVPNLLSPLLFEKQVKLVRAMFDHFREPMHNIDLVDGYGGLTADDPVWMAQLTPARGWQGSMSDHVWGYLNRVALEVHKSHPDRLVSALAYSAYTLPPESIGRLSPNLALIETRHRQEFWDEGVWNERRDLRAKWLERLPSGIYVTWDSSTNARPDQRGRPVYYTRQIARDLRDLRGVTLGEQIEICAHPKGQEAALRYDELAIEHLNLYVAARLYWDVDQSVDAMLDDYFGAYYGAAADAKRAFVTHAEANWMRMSTDAAAIGESLALLADAGRTVDPGSLPGKRIARFAEIVQPMHALQQQLGRPRETDLSYRALETIQTDGKPFKDKPLDAEKGIAGAPPKELFQWHFNLGRLRVRDGRPERTAYSPTGADDFRVPARYAKLWSR